MKSTNILLAVIALIIIVGGVYWYTQMKAVAPATTTTTPVSDTTTGQSAPAADTSGTSVTVTTVTTTSSTPTVAAPASESFTVNGNDQTADVTTITVKKGTIVHITFGADAGTTYHGGLDFRSSVISTGTIAPGSTKTVTFTANQSFSFTPYWPSTNIAKPYTIKIVVD